MHRSDQPDATPLILSSQGESPQQLNRVSEDDPLFREERLQELLVDRPGVLPISKIEPAYGPLVYLGTEISTPSGFLDVLYVSPDGYPTLVETKMWDNPEARREVVGQIVEYAKDLSEWGFEELDRAVREAGRPEGQGILERVQRRGHDIERSVFIDTVSRKLRRGEFLLLVVGNGIRENLRSLASYLQDAPNLHFSLRLVELALFRFEEGQDRPLLIQPRVMARTAEVTRAVVDVQASGEEVQVEVDVPSEDEEERSSGRQKLTESAFYEQFAGNTSRRLAEETKSLVENITDLGPETRWRSSSVSLRLPDPGDTEKNWTVVVLRADGQFKLGWLKKISGEGGYDPKIWKSYRDAVSSLTGAVSKEGGTEPASVKNLLQQKDKYVDLASEFVAALRAEAKRAEAEDDSVA